MKQVTLLIRGVQELMDQEPEVVELRTEGTLDCTGDGAYTLVYQESELTGLEGTQTTFQIQPDSVTLVREGQVNSHFLFQDGQRYQTLYHTPYGALEMSVSTQRLRVRMEENAGELEVVYTIEMNHIMTGKHRLNIQIQPAPVSQESV
ncbi:MAG: DUF1934 domain-containing protein [Oscillospiraceae bacterium]|nr:DUF1934 domain-containing protein [Oscillospiraceae bacterium]